MTRKELPMVTERSTPDTPHDVHPDSPALKRLIQEVASDQEFPVTAYNRIYTRHNR